MTLEEQARARWAMQSKGTPQTLQQAIQNATHDFFQLDEAKILGELTLESIIYSHVKDFLAQRFQVYMLGDGTVVDSTATALWERVIGIKHD